MAAEKEFIVSDAKTRADNLISGKSSIHLWPVAHVLLKHLLKRLLKQCLGAWQISA